MACCCVWMPQVAVHRDARKDYLAKVRNVALMTNVIGSDLGRTAKSEANAAAVRCCWKEVAAGEARIKLGGGKKAIDAQHAKGRLTARERVALLVDEGAEFLELGLWAADGMYEEFGGSAGGGDGGWDRAGGGAALHDRGERCDGESGGFLPDDVQEGVAGAAYCA